MNSTPPDPLLLIEDTSSLAMVYQSVLTAAGYSVTRVANHAQGWAAFQKRPVPVVLLDLVLPDGDGLSLMQDMLRLQPHTRVIVITAHGSIAKAVEAMRAGAFEFLIKPFPERRMLEVIADATRLPALRTLPDVTEASIVFAARSAAGEALRRQIQSVAASLAPVFITGDLGTGKCLAARTIHNLSSRAEFPFVPVPCWDFQPDLLEAEIFGTRSETLGDKVGLAEAAHGGTLYFDEILALPDAVQARLLQLVQTATLHPVGATAPVPVNVRLICATSKGQDLAKLRGHIRDELLFRLHVLPIYLPPLRARPADILAIAQEALKQYAQDEGRPLIHLSPAVVDQLSAHPWPGNIRELLNLMRSIVVMQQGQDIVTLDMLPAFFSQLPARPVNPSASLDFAGLTMAEIERRVIDAGLARHNGSVPRTARELDIAPSTLYRKIEAWAKGG